jgi:hypothetical protein
VISTFKISGPDIFKATAYPGIRLEEMGKIKTTQYGSSPRAESIRGLLNTKQDC